MTFARERHCRRCDGYGLVRIRYKSKESDDIALCKCRAGQWYRIAGDERVRQVLSLAADQQVQTLEAFDELKPIVGEVFK